MNPSQRPDDTPETVDLSGVLRRRWWVVAVLTVVGLVGALAYTLVAAKAYSATATVYVAPTGADANSPGSTSSSKSSTGLVDLSTEAAIVTSGTVAADAGKMMKSPLTPYQLSKQVTVTIPPSSQVLDIACSAPTPTAAATCANDFAAAYLSDRSSSAASSLTAQSNALQGKVTSLEKTVSNLNTAISGMPKGTAKRLNDEAQVGNYTTEIHSLNHQITTLDGQAANVTGGRVVTSATPPGAPSSPKKSYIIPGGLVGGLVLGLIAAFVWDRRDKRLHSAQDVERLLGMPVLMDLPRVSAGRQVSLASPRSRAGKAFTELAHGVAASLGEGSHVLLVAGTEPGPAASVVAANLAATLARTHSEAVLVCADLNDSVATELFGLSDKRGLAEVVAGRATVGEVARGPSATPRLWVIPPGADISLAEYHLQYDTAKALTSQLRRDARYVVIEAQATGDETDTLALAEFADAAVLTAETNHTSQDDASACIRRLRRLGTPILGFITLPPLGPNATFTPPQGTPVRLGAGQPDAQGPEVTGRVRGELPGIPGSPDRPVRARDGHGDPADRVPRR